MTHRLGLGGPVEASPLEVLSAYDKTSVEASVADRRKDSESDGRISVEGKSISWETAQREISKTVRPRWEDDDDGSDS